MTIVISGYGQKVDIVDGEQLNFIEVYDLDGEEGHMIPLEEEQFKGFLGFLHRASRLRHSDNGSGESPEADHDVDPEEDPEDNVGQKDWGQDQGSVAPDEF